MILNSTFAVKKILLRFLHRIYEFVHYVIQIRQSLEGTDARSRNCNPAFKPSDSSL
jgi:hypothetical protein